ncbi:MAG TPA: VWA domain-containing protein [Candidatus Angelobacter sp.]
MASHSCFWRTPIAIAALGLPLSLLAQKSVDPAPSPAPPQSQAAGVYESATVLRATTRIVVVDVVATNKKGEPVTDLKAEDFTVQEDGHAQQVRSFSFQQPVRAAQAPQSAATAPQLPEHVFTNVPAYKTDRPLNVILLDALNSTLLNQMNVREEMLKLLQKLPPERPVAIYVLGEKLQILQDFTSDPVLLQTALKNYKDHAPVQLKNPVGDPIARAIMLSRLPGMILPVFLKADQNIASMGADQRVALTADALESIAHSLSAYPGRKNLIWLSASFPIQMNAIGLKVVGEASMRNYDRQLEHMADALMSAQVAVYPIDARGEAGLSFMAASGASTHPEGVGYTDGSGVGREAVASELSDELLAAHETMNTMAERTGGKAFYNTNDLDKAVRSSLEDGATYYTLGYYPTNKEWNGKFRKIQIKAARADIKLRYRIGYFAVDPASYMHTDPKQRARDFIRALTLETPPSTALLFQARVLPPTEKTGGKVLVDFAVDPHALSFEQSGGLAHAQLKCAVEVYSPQGAPIRTEASDVATALESGPYEQVLRSNLPCRTSFSLKEGSYLLRLAVRDERTGLIGSENAELEVPAN